MNFQEYLTQRGIIEKPTDKSLRAKKKKPMGTRETEDPSDFEFHQRKKSDLYELSFETEAMSKQVSTLLDSWLMPHERTGNVISFDTRQVFEAAKRLKNEPN